MLCRPSRVAECLIYVIAHAGMDLWLQIHCASGDRTLDHTSHPHRRYQKRGQILFTIADQRLSVVGHVRKASSVTGDAKLRTVATCFLVKMQ